MCYIFTPTKIISKITHFLCYLSNFTRSSLKITTVDHLKSNEKSLENETLS